MVESDDRTIMQDCPGPNTERTCHENADPLLIEYHRAFYEQRKSYLDATLAAYKSFDKAMITLSAGALTLSIAFIKELAPGPRAETLWLLHTSWTLFGVALVIILTSFVASQYAWRRAMRREDMAFKNEVDSGESPWAVATQWMNAICLLTFGAGVVSFVCFCVANYGGEKRMSGSPDRQVKQIVPDETKGSVPPNTSLPRPASVPPSPTPKPPVQRKDTQSKK